MGFDPRKVPGEHFGLKGIRERARALGGSAAIGSEAGKGTRIVVSFPLLERAAEAGTANG